MEVDNKKLVELGGMLVDIGCPDTAMRLDDYGKVIAMLQSHLNGKNDMQDRFTKLTKEFRTKPTAETMTSIYGLMGVMNFEFANSEAAQNVET